MAQTRSPVDRLLDQKVLQGERWRAAVLAALLLIPIVGLGTGLALGSPSVDRFLPTVGGRVVIFATFFATLALEVRLFFRARERLRTSSPPPMVGRCAMATLEALLPTIVLATMLRAGAEDPITILGLPPSSLYYLLLLLSIARLEPWVCIASGGTGALGLLALVIAFVPRSDWSQLGRPLMLALATVMAALITRSFRRDANEVGRIHSTFGQYVSPKVAQKLLDQRGELPNEVRHVCVMFLDIRNFTTFAERRGPDEVVRFLNDVFAFMIDVVNEHQGVINKFLGDGFMAVFGAPESDGRDCENALAASRALIAELERRVAEGRLPPTRIGIGLHAGPAVTGNVGSATRREYTVIGDVVNLASRIESLNKELGSTLLLSGEVVAALPSRPEPLTPRGPVKVKGREAPVELFQVA